MFIGKSQRKISSNHTIRRQIEAVHKDETLILIIFPNQLFKKHPGFNLNPVQIALLEDPLFFRDLHHPIDFHVQKLWLHRASMKRYHAELETLDVKTSYHDHDFKPSFLKRNLKALLLGHNKQFATVEPADFLLKKRLTRVCKELNAELVFLKNPMFICDQNENQQYRAGKTRWFMADYYKWQRRRLNVLMDGEGPTGGKWSFDEDNRKKVPKKLIATIPSLLQLQRDGHDYEAAKYVLKNFPDHPGNLNELYYPTSHKNAEKWLDHFIKVRLTQFGDYEDAIVEGESWLWHSVLTPMLNIGLLTPNQIIKAVMNHANKNEIPLNSLEGFTRQVIGWREFMRATYEDLGVAMRTTNHWQHHRKLPQSFYDGSTGIAPVDDVIKRLNNTGYCHHIERLMVLGGFMFLCEIHPDEIYRWFMEMFIDSYDWVMVPNVYAMSQNADGGNITTKPYFSGSAYIKKMSHFGKGEWCDVWDALYWRWISNHVDELGKNPRWAMMCAMARKMDSGKMSAHQQLAESFLKKLH
jgi:deoxyribodipyrimidine photolyase-related protein